MKILLFHLNKVFLLGTVLWVVLILAVPIPWPIIIVIAVLGLAKYLVLRIAVVPALRRQITDPKDMKGQGRVVEPLAPVGLIKVGGEYWRAKSVEGDIEVDESVEVVGQERLTLMVTRSQQEEDTLKY